MAFTTSPTTQPLVPTVIPVGASNGSEVEQRSIQFARVIRSRFKIDEDVVLTLRNPILCTSDTPTLQTLASLIARLINPKLLDQVTGASNRFDLQDRYLKGLAHNIQWLARGGLIHSMPWLEASILHSMLPIYLTRSNDTVGLDIANTLTLMRRTSMLVAWSQLLAHQSSYDWLQDRFSQGHRLEESLQSVFRISIPVVSNYYWSQTGTPSRDTYPASEIVHGYWDIAVQLSRRSNEIRIPQTLKIGVVSWEKILEHWDQVLHALSVAQANENVLGSVQGAKNQPNVTIRSTAQADQSQSIALPRKADHRLVEIRSSSDPQLQINLDQLLQKCRAEQSVLSMAVVTRLNQSGETDNSGWQSNFIDALIVECEMSDLKGFITYAGELSLLFSDIDRSQLSAWIREAFSKMHRQGGQSQIVSKEVEPLVSGIAMVNAPSRTFKLDQLIESAWRCLEAAAIQGTHAVKTIEVY